MPTILPKQESAKIGYTTGTFDMVHQGHFNILKFMKLHCDQLVVGLTTDELAARQKRQPVMQFSQRRSILENCRYVDVVVAHSGKNKQEDHTKLRFNVLFIGDDYYGSSEYANLRGVSVIYIPRTPDISTTSLILSSPYIRSLEPEFNVLAYGVAGPIVALNNKVFKMIPVGYSEQNSTRDVYGMQWPRPRNWKIVGHQHTFKNFPGVNANRELQVFEILRGEPWYPVLAVRTALVRDEKEADSSGDSAAEHASPVTVALLVQRSAGVTLYDWLLSNPTELQREAVLEQVHSIIVRLRCLEVVHNDLHAKNICVKVDAENRPTVSLLDFGWCLHKSFELDEKEQRELVLKLERGFDLYHFQQSLIWFSLAEPVAVDDTNMFEL